MVLGGYPFSGSSRTRQNRDDLSAGGQEVTVTASLPEPGSVWLHRNHGRAGRVLIVDETEVILHKVEIAMIDGDPTVSWLGVPEEFAAAFEPHPETYPKTARMRS